MGPVQILRGSARLVFDAVDGATQIVEEMYRNISAAPPPVGKAPGGPAPGIAGAVHAIIRDINGAARETVESVLAPIAPLLDEGASSGPGREAVIAAVNGVVGDHLEATGNPLAIPMQFRHQGQALVTDAAALGEAFPEATAHVLFVVHGACMNDRQWTFRGHNHADTLAEAHGVTPVYVLFNSGRHISENGRDLAHRLQELVDAWPVPVETISILAHSMGGLVSRSAVVQAEEAALPWRSRLRRMAFLATPHLGAPLERGGHWINTLAEISPYTAPLARLGWLRSGGITDLRHGSLVEQDWQGRDRFRDRLPAPTPVPLPDGVRCIAVAATLSEKIGGATDRLRGDGLVPVASALARSRDPERRLAFEADKTRVFPGLNHWGVLDDPWVCDFLLARMALA